LVEFKKRVSLRRIKSIFGL